MRNKDSSSTPARNSHWLVRFVSYWFSSFKWGRKFVGGRWELWWVDSGVNAFVWLHEPRYLDGVNRPGGCAIWDRNPTPAAIEDYSANDEVEQHCSD